MGTPEATHRPLRADAERNRQRILGAASELFAERGLHVSLDDIAAHAGVGVGTVYRRFPDKHALIDALFESKVAALTELAREALEYDDPWEGFVAFFSGVCERHAQDRGLKEAVLTYDGARARVAVARDTIEPIASQVIERAQASGQLRSDIGSFDIPMLHMMVGQLVDQTRPTLPDYWRRGLAVVLDGLAVQRAEPTPLPAEALGREDFATVMAAKRGR